MKKLCYLLCFMALPCLLSAQTKEEHLLGNVTIDSLMRTPYVTWFKKNYDDYKPNTAVLAQLKQLKISDIRIKIFFATWCGDTKREMPRLIKVLDDIGFPKENRTFVALSNDKKTYKQSPNREERGYNIFRVGCYIIEKNEVEINRIAEYPALSMEHDLYAILSNQKYTPQYAAYPTLIEWLKNGTLSDDNISAQSLATQVRPLVASMSDLNACGYVLLSDGKIKEAVKIFRINANLSPENSSVWHSLAEGWHKLGNKEKALSTLEYGLEINKDPENVKSYLSLHRAILEK